MQEVSRARSRRGTLRTVFARYAAGSALSTGCAQLTFLLVFGVVGAPVSVSGVTAFLAGAVPNFLLYRYWAWRSGRLGLRGMVAYVTVIAFNGAAATALTTGVNNLIGASVTTHALRTVLLAVAFSASYGLLFVVKFVLLDQLVFTVAARRQERSRHQVATITRA